MKIGIFLFFLGLVLFISTLKRPTWLGGPKRRYTSDDTVNAMLRRSSRRSLGMYLAGIGAIFWSFDDF
ncbi:MAG: hypothetical protein AAF541_12260 [Pseudomonadota bacterium]